MNITKSHFALALCTVLLYAVVVSKPAHSDTVGVQPNRNVAGVWMVTLAPRNCITGIPIPGAAFEGLYTFHKDGMMSVWVQNAVIALTRSPSHGLWKRDQGWSEYSFGFVHLRYDGSGFFAGKQVAEGTLVLSDDGNAFTSDSVNTFFDVQGNPQGTGCGSAVGTRFELNP